MRAHGGRGFSMVEVLIVAVVLGVGLGGLASLTAACARGEGEAGRCMEARLRVLASLEQGAPAPAPAPLRVTCKGGRGLREARAAWPEGRRAKSVRLQRWCGHD